ncbi:MAG: hypothetical protein N3A68_02520 [Bacteroidia bacterium]|nr:hypothetical protein [Bacteroidia bacterium]GIV23191.1 MAG: hypothetical protein KatS3mg025_0850 [Bacteroidia bacterium]
MRWSLLCLLLVHAYAQEGDSLDIGDELWEDFLSAPASAPKDTGTSPISEVPWMYDTLLESPKPPPPLRLIDSPIARDLTSDPKTNRRISTNRAFNVKIVRPIPQNTKGHPLIHGFDKWYLYIVKAEEVRIENRVMRTNGLPVYLAIVSPAPQIEELPTVLESPALMLKGLVDYGDTIVKYFKQEKNRLKATLDSLLTLPLPPDELQADQMEALLTRVADSLVYAEAYYQLYRDFKRAKGSGKALVQFFLSFPFNRTLTYSIYSAPYALPRYLPPETTSVPEERKRKGRRS